MALMGKQGIPAVANLCIQKAHYMADQLKAIDGVEMMFDQPFFKEFAVKLPVPPKKVIDALRAENIFAGIDLARFDYGINDGLLIAVTEKRTKEEIDKYTEVLKKVIS